MNNWLFKRTDQIFIILVTLISILLLFNTHVDFKFFTNSVHVIQSLSFLEGNIHLPLDPNGKGPDLHYFNGAWHSAWGYGIPILQMPFHFISIILTNKSFPDLLIFIFYSLISTSITYKFLNSRTKKFLAIPAAFSIIGISLFWLITYRFLIYEESAAYFILFTINSFVYFIESIEKDDTKFIPYLVLNLFILIMIRQTGIVLSLLIFIYFLIKKRNLLFPFIIWFIFPGIVYAYLNYIKSGSIFPSGPATSNPGLSRELFFTRIASPCYFGTNIEVYIERFLYIFKSFFLLYEPSAYEPRASLGITQNCTLVLEDSWGNKKPWFHLKPYVKGEYNFFIPFFSLVILSSIFILLLYKKFVEISFIIFGFLTTLLIYTFLANGVAYRYSVDFYFYSYFSIYCIYKNSVFPKKIYFRNTIYRDKFRLDYFFKIILTVLIVYSCISNIKHTINQNGNTILFNTGIDVTKLNWNYTSLEKDTRYCNDKIREKFKLYDKRGWRSDCRVIKYVNLYISKPSGKNLFKINIKGKNIPKRLYVRINGRVYKNFDINNDRIKLGPEISNIYNLFIYDKTHSKNFYIEEISLQ